MADDTTTTNPGTANPPANPGAGPTGLTPADLHNAAEKARLEERTKLRGELEAANIKTKDLETQVGQLTNANQKLTTDLQTLQQSLKPEGGVDVNKLIESVVNRVNTEWSTRFTKMEEELRAEKSTRQKLTVEQLRARLISQHGGENAMIPELVSGNDEAEILASIEEAKLKYASILARVGAAPGGQGTPSQQTTNGQGTASQALPAMNIPQGGSSTPGGAQPQGGVTARAMTREESAQKRNDLKKKAAARYPSHFVTQ